MTHLLFIDQGEGIVALEEAWRYVYEESISLDKIMEMRKKDQGRIIQIGQRDNQNIYWVTVGGSLYICRQAWNEWIPLLGDSILNWKFIVR